MTIKEALEDFPTDIRTEYRKPREAQAFQAGIEFVLKWLEDIDK